MTEDTEPGSDHMYLILATSAVPPPRAPRAGRRPPRWALKCLDIDAARLASSVVAWPPLPGDTLDDPAAGALWLRGALHSICDASMSRAGPPGRGRRSVYWWFAEIANLRALNLRARRRYTNARCRDPQRVTGDQLQELRAASSVEPLPGLRLIRAASFSSP